MFKTTFHTKQHTLFFIFLKYMNNTIEWSMDVVECWKILSYFIAIVSTYISICERRGLAVKDEG